MKRGERERRGGGRKEEEGENLILFFSAVSTCHREFFFPFPVPTTCLYSISSSTFIFHLLLTQTFSVQYHSPFLQSSITWPLLHFSTFFFFLAVVCFLSVYCKNISLSLHWIYPLLYYFPSLSLPVLYVSFFYSVKATQFSCYAISLSLFLDCQSKESTLLARFKVALDSLGDS